MGSGARRGWPAVAGRWSVLAGAVALAGASGCARQSAPPGGPPDNRPPVVTATVPEAFDDVPDFEGPVRFEFNERISEQAGAGALDEAVTVSPATGEVRVSHGRSSLSVDVEGGFHPNVVYRITLHAVVRDMFGNALRDPFELVFTTGAEAEPTTVAGEVWDRITGQGMSGLRLHAVGPDTLPHVAVSGQDGIYAFRYLPGGSYTVRAFDDVDRDREAGPNELQGRVEVTVEPADTAFVDVPVLTPDTTAAVLLGAEALDSVTLALRFDDYLDPGASLDEAEIELEAPMNGTAPTPARRFHEEAYRDYVEMVSDSLARVDSIARANAVEPLPVAEPLDRLGPDDPDAAPEPDTVTGPDGVPAPDSLTDTLTDTPTDPVAPAVPERRGPPELEGPDAPGAAAARARGRALPGRRIVIVLDEPLEQEVVYEVVVREVANVNGLGGGGGGVEVTFSGPEEEEVPPEGEGPGTAESGGGR
ncbi:MAG: Ig-like domain-containing protein [Gemmatimonadota bacterium]|nr:Ig-like domain-containing protein [Gemmatimonadota bacterium]